MVHRHRPSDHRIRSLGSPPTPFEFSDWPAGNPISPSDFRIVTPDRRIFGPAPSAPRRRAFLFLDWFPVARVAAIFLRIFGLSPCSPPRRQSPPDRPPVIAAAGPPWTSGFSDLPCGARRPEIALRFLGLAPWWPGSELRIITLAPGTPPSTFGFSESPRKPAVARGIFG